MKKFLSVVLAMVLILTFSVSSLAAQKNDVSDSYVEVSIDDLNRGISVAFYNDEFGRTIVKTITAQEAKALAQAASTKGEPRLIGAFNVNLTPRESRQFYLNYKAISPDNTGFTFISGSWYCKDTSAVYPEEYFSGSLPAPRDLTGANKMINVSSDELFVIPSGVNKVRIGYTNVRLSTVTDNYSAGSKSKAVNS